MLAIVRSYYITRYCYQNLHQFFFFKTGINKNTYNGLRHINLVDSKSRLMPSQFVLVLALKLRVSLCFINILICLLYVYGVRTISNVRALLTVYLQLFESKLGTISVDFYLILTLKTMLLHACKHKQLFIAVRLSFYATYTRTPSGTLQTQRLHGTDYIVHLWCSCYTIFS